MQFNQVLECLRLEVHGVHAQDSGAVAYDDSVVCSWRAVEPPVQLEHATVVSVAWLFVFFPWACGLRIRRRGLVYYVKSTLFRNKKHEARNPNEPVDFAFPKTNPGPKLQNPKLQNQQLQHLIPP